MKEKLIAIFVLLLVLSITIGSLYGVAYFGTQFIVDLVKLHAAELRK